MENETIAAIATPPGEGGIAIIRISGAEAIIKASRIFSKKLENVPTHTIHFGHIQDGQKIDEALALVMRSPRSYTGEDVVELQCHGGHIASARVLEALAKVGVKMAQPGEFTYRAFLNGKLDLAQAEAVQKLIGAKSEKAFHMAQKNLEGALSLKINDFKKRILYLSALFEAWVDFPEEDLEFTTFEKAALQLEEIIFDMEKLLATYHDGEKIQNGISLCIVGAPNVGKSSLMNALLAKEKAIVTPIAGTTRDLIEAEFILNGLAFRLIDTAGIRETEEIIEKEGIRRSHKAKEEADIILFLLDATQGMREEEKQLYATLPPKRTLTIWNKIDLAPTLEKAPHNIPISVKTGAGLPELKKRIYDLAFLPFHKDEVILTSYRHKEALQNSKESLEKALLGLKAKEYQEILALELRTSLQELGKILGNDVTEEILSTIFANFCIGK